MIPFKKGDNPYLRVNENTGHIEIFSSKGTWISTEYYVGTLPLSNRSYWLETNGGSSIAYAILHIGSIKNGIFEQLKQLDITSKEGYSDYLLSIGYNKVNSSNSGWDYYIKIPPASTGKTISLGANITNSGWHNMGIEFLKGYNFYINFESL